MKQPKRKSIISSENLTIFRKDIEKIINNQPKLKRGNFLPMVRSLLAKRGRFLSICSAKKTPFYIIDVNELNNSILSFKSVFNKFMPQSRIFYAMKVNPHPFIIKKAVENGFGIDASSGREIEIALKNGAKQIIFTGPGKLNPELDLAIKYHDKITVNLDSFGELERLGLIAASRKTPINAGIRISSSVDQAWNKFGIPLSRLSEFWKKSKNYPQVKLSGIQFHQSFNDDIDPYREMIKRISAYLRRNFSVNELRAIKFFDIGGGFRPSSNEGFFPWNTALGELYKIAEENFNRRPEFIDRHYQTGAVTLEKYAHGIAAVLKKYLGPLLECSYYLEPGHIICHSSTHIILSVIDIKDAKHIILDGGINLVGWEKFEYFYYPLINLTHPSFKEIDGNFYGNLCLPEDNWGYYCYSGPLKEDDKIMVPCQGAMAYALAQNFIRPIAKIYYLKSNL